MENRQKIREKDTGIKLRFYFMSLWLLFVLIFLLTIDIPISFAKDAHFIGIMPLLEKNWLAFSSLLLAILGWIVASGEKRRWAGVSNPPYKIVLLVLFGFIFIRMDLYCGNPTLALMGYRLYRAEIEGVDAPDGVILISKNRLLKESSIKWIPIDKYVWIAKEIINDIG